MCSLTLSSLSSPTSSSRVKSEVSSLAHQDYIFDHRLFIIGTLGNNLADNQDRCRLHPMCSNFLSLIKLRHILISRRSRKFVEALSLRVKPSMSGILALVGDPDSRSTPGARTWHAGGQRLHFPVHCLTTGTWRLARGLRRSREDWGASPFVHRPPVSRENSRAEDIGYQGC